MKQHGLIQLSQLADMNEPAAVLEEVKWNFVRSYPVAEFLDVRRAFGDFLALYAGAYTGYRACNTKFHDRIHTTDALLAISRLIDGYNVRNTALPVREVKIALLATIFHDSGYVQTVRDKTGTGAKYTRRHVERSIAFIEKYFRRIGYSRRDFLAARSMINCTGLETKVDQVRFADGTERTLGFMLGTADLLGQMASRTYLERLIYLYREFKEGHVQGFASEHQLLVNTLKFHTLMRVRLERQLEGVGRCMIDHFRERYRIDEDLYDVAINRQMAYLEHILQDSSKSYRRRLKRRVEIK